MLGERLDGRHPVQADQPHAIGLGHAQRRAGRHPAVADADAERLHRQQFKPDDRIGERLLAEEHVRSRKLRVVAGAAAGAAAGELIFAGGEHRQLLDQRVGMTGERVGHDQRRTIGKFTRVEALKGGDDVAGRLGAIGADAEAEAGRRTNVLRTEREGARRADAAALPGELTRGRRADEQRRPTAVVEYGEQRAVLEARRREHDDDVRRLVADRLTNLDAKVASGLFAVFTVGIHGGGSHGSNYDMARRA